MAHFEDRGTTTQIACGPHVRAVGWLSRDQPFPTGAEPHAPFLGRLRRLCERWSDGIVVLGWPVAAGAHTCDLCGQFRASGNIGVPARGVLFVAPEMVAHYVERHQYLPPSEFVAAVLVAPEPGSPAYVAAIKPFLSGEDR